MSECGNCGESYDPKPESGKIPHFCNDPRQAQLDRIEAKVNELHSFAQQIIAAMEQFQAGGMGKMLMNMMGGGRK